MALNPNIILGLRSPKIDTPDPVDQYTKGLQLKGLMSQQALSDQAVADDQSNRTAFASSGGDSAKYLQALASGGNYKGYMAAQKADLDRQKAAADISHVQAQTTQATASAGKSNVDAQVAAIEHVSSILATAKDPQSYAVARQTIGKLLPQALQNLPEQYDPMVVQSTIAGGVKRSEQLKAEHDAATLAQNKVIADDRNKTQITTTGMTNATSRANNAATIQKDYNVAGISPNGGGVSQDLREMAQAVADGKVQPPTGMALNHPRMQLLMNEVMKINPNFDATSYGAKLKAAKDFGSGSQGNAMRSFAVAGQHLDQLGQLVDALNNGNTQLINKIGNTISQQTGSPNVTNFDAAKDVVSKEVVKAIVAGGGGVAERQELSHLMENAKSPAQLKGVIKQYRALMAAQHDALLQQRDAAGLSRSTLPNYTDANGSAEAPATPPAKTKAGATVSNW